MRLSTIQIIVLAAAIALFVLLLSLGRTKPLHKKSDAADATDTLAPLNDESMMAGARSGLDSSQLSFLAGLEQQKAQAKNIEEEVLTLKLISRTWNEFGNFAAGGYHAQKVAELSPSGMAWAIAGSTFGIAFNKETKDIALKKYVGHKSIEAFQKAAELEPDTLSHQINEALMYVELSMVDPKVMPMTGAQKLLAVDKAHPNNVNVNLQLGRLSLTRSGDVQKALPRFERIVAIADTSTIDAGVLLEAHFSLAECYKQLKDAPKVMLHYDRCIELTKTNPAMQQQLKEAKTKFEKEGK